MFEPLSILFGLPRSITLSIISGVTTGVVVTSSSKGKNSSSTTFESGSIAVGSGSTGASTVSVEISG